ncbi:MAG TPA: hypothetical protein VFL97_11170 [Nitrococcus sp.]|nr:hypothetical protein [Nitrococcus sp.]
MRKFCFAPKQKAVPAVIRVRIEGMQGKALAALLLDIQPKIEAPIREGALITVTANAVRIRSMPLAKS